MLCYSNFFLFFLIFYIHKRADTLVHIPFINTSKYIRCVYGDYNYADVEFFEITFASLINRLHNRQQIFKDLFTLLI